MQKTLSSCAWWRIWRAWASWRGWSFQSENWCSFKSKGKILLQAHSVLKTRWYGHFHATGGTIRTGWWSWKLYEISSTSHRRYGNSLYHQFLHSYFYKMPGFPRLVTRDDARYHRHPPGCGEGLQDSGRKVGGLWPMLSLWPHTWTRPQSAYSLDCGFIEVTTA